MAVAATTVYTFGTPSRTPGGGGTKIAVHDVCPANTTIIVSDIIEKPTFSLLARKTDSQACCRCGGCAVKSGDGGSKKCLCDEKIDAPPDILVLHGGEYTCCPQEDMLYGTDKNGKTSRSGAYYCAPCHESLKKDGQRCMCGDDAAIGRALAWFGDDDTDFSDPQCGACPAPRTQYDS